MNFFKFKSMRFVLYLLGFLVCFIAYPQERAYESGEYVKSIVLWYEHEFFEPKSPQYVSWNESKLKNPVDIVKSLQRHFLENAVKERNLSVNNSDIQEVALNFMSYNLQIIYQNNGKIFIYAYPAGLYTKRQLLSFLYIKTFIQCDHYWYAEYDSNSGKILNSCVHIVNVQKKSAMNAK